MLSSTSSHLAERRPNPSAAVRCTSTPKASMHLLTNSVPRLGFAGGRGDGMRHERDRGAGPDWVLSGIHRTRLTAGCIAAFGAALSHEACSHAIHRHYLCLDARVRMRW